MTTALIAGSLRLSPTPRVRPAADGSRQNIVLVTLDTTRSRNLGAYGYARARTPNLDRLAREGVRFAHAYTPVPQTAPSHATILTGLHPAHHGVLYNGWRLPGEAVTLPEILRARGYDTAAAVSVDHLARAYGFAQGIDTYFDRSPLFDRFYVYSHSTGSRFSIPVVLRMLAVRAGGAPWLNMASHERRGDRTMDLALQWLARPRTRPFFLWVHLFDPHAPYKPPPGYTDPFRVGAAVLPESPFPARKIRDLLDRYDGEVSFVDVQVGRLIEALRPVRERTLVVVVADHGESLGEHGWRGHNSHVTQEVIEVPLILDLPGRLPKGRVEQTRVFTMDIAPTVLEVAGLRVPRPMDGQSLLRPVPDRTLVLQSENPSGFRIRGIMVGDLKVTRTWPAGSRDESWSGGRREIYDLSRDPPERTNLAANHRSVPERAASMESELRGFYGTVRVKRQEVSSATRAMLRALGYVE